jgi:hypothetical protein
MLPLSGPVIAASVGPHHCCCRRCARTPSPPPPPPLCRDLFDTRSIGAPHLYVLSGAAVTVWASLPPSSTSYWAAPPWGVLPSEILFSMTPPPPHCRQQEPTELPLALHYLTVGVQYAYEKDSENTGLHCCENVLIELDQWCSSFVLKWPLKKRNRFYET